jgi:hypothetical protein
MKNDENQEEDCPTKYELIVDEKTYFVILRLELLEGQLYSVIREDECVEQLR